MDKIKRGIGTNDNYDDYEDDYYNEFDGDEDVAGAQNVQNGVDPMATQGIGLSGLSQMSSGISLSGTALELKVVKPQHFDSVPQIADHLLNKRTVVLNLENTNKETARRLIDFLSGVAYSIDGSLKKIASNAYVITPSNVDVGDAQLRDKRQRAEQQEAAPAAENDLGEF
jgi:cell division inhibitor SepF